MIPDRSPKGTSEHFSLETYGNRENTIHTSSVYSVSLDVGLFPVILTGEQFDKTAINVHTCTAQCPA